MEKNFSGFSCSNQLRRLIRVAYEEIFFILIKSIIADNFFILEHILMDLSRNRFVLIQSHMNHSTIHAIHWNGIYLLKLYTIIFAAYEMIKTK